MFDELYEIIDAVKSLNNADAFDYAMSQEDSQEEAIRLNTNEQLFTDGVLANGRPTGKYSMATIQIKKKKNLPWKHVTLFDTGEFHSGFTADVGGGEMNLHAPLNHSRGRIGIPRDVLLSIYGDFEGLTPENCSTLAQFIEPKISDYVLNKILW